VEAIQFTQEAAYPLFLSCAILDHQEIDFIPRDKSNAHTKYLAKSLLEYIVAEAIIQKSEVKPFKGNDGISRGDKHG
jgi:hypothetical protein